jgi:SAM-dependent methyltransferase
VTSRTSSPPGDPLAAALQALSDLPPPERLAAAACRLSGGASRLPALDALPVGSELTPADDRLDGRLLEALCAQTLDGARGAVFTPAAEARLLAALGLACAAARRGGPEPSLAAAQLLAGQPGQPLGAALEGLTVLDPCCGGGALLAAAEGLARGVGARLSLFGRDVSALAAEATTARLALLGARANVAQADALALPWPAADLLLGNPPFLRHELLPAAAKARATRVSGLSAQADLSAHVLALAFRHAEVVAVVWPRALDTARSAQPLLAEARARGGFRVRLRSRAAGSFTASVDTRLAVWVAGAPGDAPDAEAAVPLAALEGAEVAALLRRVGGRRVRLARATAAPRGAVTLGEVCQVRFGTKTGCNAFFHLVAEGAGAYRSALCGPVRLADGDVVPLLASLREARAPSLAATSRVLFRPAVPGAAARRYIARGEAAGVHLRPTCAGRAPWWRLVPGRAPAPVLYPAKVGARAFAFLNAGGLWEDKKWHALFPLEVDGRLGIEPWQLALLLSATPVRLAVEEGARQLTGAQAIADVDCHVLAAAPFPRPEAIAAAREDLAALWAALRCAPVTTDLGAMLARPAQRELDQLAGALLGLRSADVTAARATLAERVEDRLAHAAAIKQAGLRLRGAG